MNKFSKTEGFMYKYISLQTHEADEKIYQLTYNAMTSNRKNKILRLKNENQKKLSLLGEYLAKTLICQEKNISFDDIIIETGTNGKPFVPQFSDIHFNISHSVDIAIAAISHHSIGVDVEKIRPVSLKLADRVCNEDEKKYIFGITPTQKDYEISYPNIAYNRFFEIWTMKEAYFKYTGTGITDFKSFNCFKNEITADKITIDDYIIHIVY